MDKTLSMDDFKNRCNSLYELVIAGSRRASQLAKPETRPLVSATSKKPTMIALEEILQGKVEVHSGSLDDEDYLD